MIRYSDVMALLKSGQNYSFTRDAWDDNTYIVMENENIMIVTDYEVKNGIGFHKMKYVPNFSDVSTEDWMVYIRGM